MFGAVLSLRWVQGREEVIFIRWIGLAAGKLLPCVAWWSPILKNTEDDRININDMTITTFYESTFRFEISKMKRFLCDLTCKKPESTLRHICWPDRNFQNACYMNRVRIHQSYTMPGSLTFLLASLHSSSFFVWYGMSRRVIVKIWVSSKGHDLQLLSFPSLLFDVQNPDTSGHAKTCLIWIYPTHAVVAWCNY